jgi:hypothetical protein
MFDAWRHVNARPRNEHGVAPHVEARRRYQVGMRARCNAAARAQRRAHILRRFVLNRRQRNVHVSVVEPPLGV